MTKKETFANKASDGYIVCYAEGCPKKEQCLRWLVGQQMPATKNFITNVNLQSKDVGTDKCPHFRNKKKVKIAIGMTHIFNGDMPARVEPFVRHRIISNHCRTYYYEFRNGSRPIMPAVQEEIRSVFREAGWNKPVEFDKYIEDYEW